MHLTPGLTAWQTSPTPSQCNLSSLRERKVSQWKWLVSMETIFGSPPPSFPYKGRLWMSQHPWSHMSRLERQPFSSRLTSPYVQGRQLSYVSGSASTCCCWFTTSNADSWAHRLGINCTGAQSREMSYALFSSSWNNQFLGSSFVMEMAHSALGKKIKEIDFPQGHFLID